MFICLKWLQSLLSPNPEDLPLSIYRRIKPDKTDVDSWGAWTAGSAMDAQICSTYKGKQIIKSSRALNSYSGAMLECSRAADILTMHHFRGIAGNHHVSSLWCYGPLPPILKLICHNENNCFFKILCSMSSYSLSTCNLSVKLLIENTLQPCSSNVNTHCGDSGSGDPFQWGQVTSSEQES